MEDYLLAFDSNNCLAAVKPPHLSLLAASLGHFGNFWPPVELCTTNLERLRLLVLLDRAHNDASYRRQNSADVQKTSGEIELEKSPLVVAALFSLARVSSLALQQWSPAAPTCQLPARLDDQR